MDLSTNYLGLKLRTPLVVAASPLSDDIDKIKRMEDAGAAGVVLYSLFEEQLRRDRLELAHNLEQGTESFAEALTYFPEPEEYHLGPEDYLKHIASAKKSVKMPIIASLNGSSAGGWTSYAKAIQQAGADALELNIYYIPTDLNMTGAEVEQTYLDILTAVKAEVTIPVSVKLSPFFSNFANMAKRLDEAGANGLVLFNRFYQPDFDLQDLGVTASLTLSTSNDLLLRLRWLAVLFGRVKASLAVTGGVHTPVDALKAVMAGAGGVQVVSSLLKNGPEHIKGLVDGMRAWLEEHEYDSLKQAMGSMSLERSPNPAAFERANYMKVLAAYQLTIG
jgi:dihydroorotate dehydrogenase (fumarate)